jgi:hypothetical protein
MADRPGHDPRGEHDVWGATSSHGADDKVGACPPQSPPPSPSCPSRA